MQNPKNVLLFMVVCLTWGTTWLAMRIAVETIPPLFATGMRFMFASPFLLLMAHVTRAPLLFPPGQRLFQLIICLFYFAIPYTLMIYGEIYVSSGLASIVFATMPVAVLLASYVILGEVPTLARGVGMMFAFISLMAILLTESTLEGENSWRGIAALITAVVIHAVVYTLCKKRGCNVSVVTFNALPCVGAAALLLAAGYLIEQPDISGFTKSSVLATAYLGAIAGVFGILCYFALQQAAGTVKASLVFLVFPLVAVMLESLVYKESIALSSIILFLPLAAGLILTLRSFNRQ